jgi:hypothetical protein
MHAVLEKVAAKIEGELDGLDVIRSREHPNGNDRAWNIHQIVEHLTLNCRFTTATLEKRLAKRQITRKQKRTALQRALELMVLSFAYVPEGTPALEETTPVEGVLPPMSGRELGRVLCAEMDAMDAVLDRCRGRFGMERVAVHPIFGALRVDQWRRWIALESGSHLRQMERVRTLVAPHAEPKRPPRAVLAKELHIPAQSPFA